MPSRRLRRSRSCRAPPAPHGALQGVGDFYAGLLHPLVAPAEALALIAAGLLLGTSGLAASRWGLLALALGVAAGLASGGLMEGYSTGMLLGLTFASAAPVAAGLRLPPLVAIRPPRLLAQPSVLMHSLIRQFDALSLRARPPPSLPPLLSLLSSRLCLEASATGDAL